MRAIAQLPDAAVTAGSQRGTTSSCCGLAFAVANYAAMIAWPSWETIPFHFVWISLTLLYGFRVWPLRATLIVLGLS